MQLSILFVCVGTFYSSISFAPVYVRLTSIDLPFYRPMGILGNMLQRNPAQIRSEIVKLRNRIKNENRANSSIIWLNTIYLPQACLDCHKSHGSHRNSDYNDRKNINYSTAIRKMFPVNLHLQSDEFPLLCSGFERWLASHDENRVFCVFNNNGSK